MLLHILSSNIIVSIVAMVGKTKEPTNKEIIVTYRQNRPYQYTCTDKTHGKYHYCLHRPREIATWVGAVILSAAKDLSARRARPFAALRVTGMIARRVRPFAALRVTGMIAKCSTGLLQCNA